MVGWLAGLTASSIVETLLPLLFALMGGSVLVFLDKMREQMHSLSGGMLLSFSLFCVVGMTGAIYVTEHHLLSPGHQISVEQSRHPEANVTQLKAATPCAEQSKDSEFPAARNKYVRSELTSAANAIDTLYRNRQIDAKQAYERLYDSLTSSKGTPDAECNPHN